MNDEIGFNTIWAYIQQSMRKLLHEDPYVIITKALLYNCQYMRSKLFIEAIYTDDGGGSIYLQFSNHYISVSAINKLCQHMVEQSNYSIKGGIPFYNKNDINSSEQDNYITLLKYIETVHNRCMRVMNLSFLLHMHHLTETKLDNIVVELWDEMSRMLLLDQMLSNSDHIEINKNIIKQNLMNYPWLFTLYLIDLNLFASYDEEIYKDIYRKLYNTNVHQPSHNVIR